MPTANILTRQGSSFLEDGQLYSAEERKGFDVSIRHAGNRADDPADWIHIYAHEGQTENFSQEFHNVLRDLPDGDYLLAVRDVPKYGKPSLWSQDEFLPNYGVRPLPPSITITLVEDILSTVSIDFITADNIINASEADGSVDVTGFVIGDLQEGDTATLIVNGVSYSGVIETDNTFSISVSGSDLAAQQSLEVIVNGTDVLGGPVSASATANYSVDTETTASISVDKIAGDGVINAAEAAANIGVTGSVSGDAEVGDAVSFIANGNTYGSTILIDNTFVISVPGSDLAAQSSIDVFLTGFDSSGNQFVANKVVSYSVQTISPVVTAVTAPDTSNTLDFDVVVAATGHTEILVIESDTQPAPSLDNPDWQTNSTFTVTVTGEGVKRSWGFAKDAAGNISNTLSDTTTVAISAEAAITIDDLTDDNVINFAESIDGVTITGLVSGQADVGDTVTTTINGTVYTGSVQAGKAYSIFVSGADIAAETSVTMYVYGNHLGTPFSAQATKSYTVDLNTSATITVDAITDDDIVNAVEAANSINVTGTVGGSAEAGNTITFTVNGTNYTGEVLTGNVYSIPVSGSDLANDTSFDITVTGINGAGNAFTATTTSNHTVDVTSAASITVDNITTDDIVNASEASGVIDVTGTVSGDAIPGHSIDFTVNGTNYSGLVLASNTYSVPVAGSDLVVDTSFNISVSGNDAAGNPFTATVTSDHTVQTSASATITIDTIMNDDIIDRSESFPNHIVSGTVGGAAKEGDTVSFTKDAVLYETLVLADNTFSFDLSSTVLTSNRNYLVYPSLHELNSLEITVQGTTDAGNTYSQSAIKEYTISYVKPATPTIIVNNITSDNIVNTVESGGNIIVSGSVSGEGVVEGQEVVIGVNTINTTTLLDSNLEYSVELAGSEFATVTDVLVTTVAQGDFANPSEPEFHTHTYVVDTTAPSGTITIDDITGDNILNADDIAGSVTITGSVSGDFDSIDSSLISVNSIAFPLVFDGSNNFSGVVPGSTMNEASFVFVGITLEDTAGNTTGVFSNKSYSVQELPATTGGWTGPEDGITEGNATITVGNITLDDIVNAAEAAGNIDVTGTVGGDASQGDPVTFTINGTNYSGLVLADNTFTISVAGSDLAADNSFDVTVTGSDNAGNPFTATTTSGHTVDLTIPSVSITIDEIAIDDILLASDISGTVTITGSVTGDIADIINTVPSLTLVHGTATAGQNVSIPFTLDGSNNFSIDVAGQALADAIIKRVTVLINTVDGAGNQGFGASGRDYQVALFETVVEPVDFTSSNTITAEGGSYQVDWGDGVFIPYADGQSALNIASNTIKVRSINNITHVRFNTDTFTDINIMLSNTLTDLSDVCNNLTNLLSFAITDSSNVSNLHNSWQDCSSLTSFPLIDTSNVIQMTGAWSRCSSLTSFPAIDTSSVTNMTGAWNECTSLVSFPLINTINVTYFLNTWRKCSSLNSFPAIDTSSAVVLRYAWQDCSSLNSFPAIDTSSVTEFTGTFQGCTSLVCISTLDTTAVTNPSLVINIFALTPALIAPNSSEQSQLANIPGGFNYINPNPCL